MLSSGLRLLHEAQEVTLALSEALADGLYWVLRKLLVLDNEIVQIVAQVVSAGRTSVAVKHPEEADLRPLDIQVLLVLWFQNV